MHPCVLGIRGAGLGDGADEAPGGAPVAMPFAEFADRAKVKGTRRQGGNRSKFTEERMQPYGATLRRYDPAHSSPHWVGVLPAEQKDDIGHHTKSGTWGMWVQRSEMETIIMIEEWIAKHAKAV